MSRHFNTAGPCEAAKHYNALAREIVDKMNVPAPEPITIDHVDRAKERLILARATHLDSLLARLTEPRVRQIIETLCGSRAECW